MRKGPLADPRLSEIEAKLNAARFDEAQRLLAGLSDVPSADAASVYFATRLLFQRGRLDAAGVVERLRDLIGKVGSFPEAESLMRAAEQGVLTRAREARGISTRPPPSALSTAGPTPSSRRAPETFPDAIPRAPPLPRFTPNPRVPSYAPPTQQRESITVRAPDNLVDGEMLAARDTELSPPPPPPSVQSRRRPSFTEEEPTVPGGRSKQPAARQRRPSSNRSKKRRLPSIPELEVPDPKTARAPRRTSVPYVETLPSPPPLASTRPRSTLPAPSVPTLFDVAEALDKGDPPRAIELAERAEAKPELVLVKARALAALGNGPGAEAELAPLLRAPLLDPALRAGMARLFIELGSPERALEQARRALEDDPKDPRARLVCAWALLRVSRRTGDDQLRTEAEPLLVALRVRERPLMAVLAALRALVALGRGDARRALTFTENALSHDPSQPDALLALALASARLGMRPEAERALERLDLEDPAEAAACAPLLSREGLAAVGPDAPVRTSEARLAELWGPVEAALVHGNRRLAVANFERACTERVRATSRRAASDVWQKLAVAAARLFTELDVLRHFAPFDCSLFSIDRLAAAFDVLYGPGGTNSEPNEAVIRLGGAYVGESMRQAFGGEWHGSPQEAVSASVEALGLSIKPCERVLERLRRGQSLVLTQPSRLHPGADPLGNNVPLSLTPPCPWDPEPWPTPTRMPELGQLLPDSVVGLYCALRGEPPLELTLPGSAAIDRYVALVAPAKAPSDPDAPWVRRSAVLVGAYLGEVLVQSVGAEWQEGVAAAGPESYRLLLNDGSIVTPVARAFDRVSGRRSTSLSEYVTRVAGGRPSVRA